MALIDTLLLPFQYNYMLKAIVVSAGVGAVCAFLSCYLMLKGWSLMGDALSHSVVPGVAAAYVIGFPYSIGAFLTGILAALAMTFINNTTRLKVDAIIGFIFSTFFAIGLLIVSLFPTSVNIQSIIMGNILSIADSDIWQLAIIVLVSLAIMLCYWKDLLVVFFDEQHATTQGISPVKLKILFFTLLSACTVAALQTVGAILVIAMVITPGASAFLLTKRFGVLIILSVIIGSLTCAIGAYLSFFLNGATGGLIVSLQTLIFVSIFIYKRFTPRRYSVTNNRYSSAAGKQL